jgi:hypothetical protein
VTEPLVDRAHLGAGVQCQHEPSVRAQRPGERGDRIGQLGGCKVHERVPGEDSAPTVVADRAQQLTQITDLVAHLRMPAPRLGHHLRAEVQTGRVRPGAGQERGDVTWSGADLDHRCTVGELGHPAQQPRLEGQRGELVVELVCVRAGHRGVGRPHLCIPSIRAVGED